MMFRFVFIVITFLLFSCQKEKQFTKIDYSGIVFENNLDYTENLNPYTYRNFYNGAGVAMGDINNDGLIDVYLTGNPEITLFKSNYQRHTHFAMETIIVNFDGNDVSFGNDKIHTATVSKIGALISKMVLVIKYKKASF